MPLSDIKRQELEKFALNIRIHVLESLNHLGFYHYGEVFPLLRPWRCFMEK